MVALKCVCVFTCVHPSPACASFAPQWPESAHLFARAQPGHLTQVFASPGRPRHVGLRMARSESLGLLPGFEIQLGHLLPSLVIPTTWVTLFQFPLDLLS